MNMSVKSWVTTLLAVTILSTGAMAGPGTWRRALRLYENGMYEQAQALYRKCGFVEAGRRHNALKFDDGTSHDEILMYKLL